MNLAPKMLPNSNQKAAYFLDRFLYRFVNDFDLQNGAEMQPNDPWSPPADPAYAPKPTLDTWVLPKPTQNRFPDTGTRAKHGPRTPEPTKSRGPGHPAPPGAKYPILPWLLVCK